jgi:hypothetical protein
MKRSAASQEFEERFLLVVLFVLGIAAIVLHVLRH